MRWFLYVFVPILLFSCQAAPNQRISATLDEVETYIIERPDSALAVLQALDATALTARPLRARYSLLHTMAMDKCDADITVPGLLDPAVAWYARHGSADDKMKTFYYQGRIAQEKGDQNEAAVSYSRAEELAGSVSDKHALGLLYVAVASVYNAVYNTQKELEYYEKALAVFGQSRDPMYDSVMGDLALVYHTREEWDKADSLYRAGINHSEDYPHALCLYLSNYARMKVQQPEKDPDGTIGLLDRKREISGSLTPKEAGAYAYALALSGRTVASESLRSRLDTLSGRARYDVLPWLRRIALHQGDYETAYLYLVESRKGEDAVITETLTDPVNQALRDYYEQSSQRERERRLRLGVWALAAIIVLLSIAVLLLFRGRRMRMERDRLIAIRAGLEQDIQDREASVATLSTDLSSRLAQLRLQLRTERLDRLRNGSRYGYWLWMGRNGRSSDAVVIKALQKDLREICALEKDPRSLEYRLDRELDGIVSHLKEDLGLKDGSDDVLFLCYWLIDLKPDMVAELLGISVNNVYVKTHRLEARIRKLDKTEYAFLVEE